MLLVATFFIIVFVLLIVNSIPIFGSKRTKRFAKIPSLFFFILFTLFWVGRVVGFLYYEMNGQKERALDTSYDVKNVRGKIYTKGEAKKDFASKNQIDSQQKSFFEDVNYVLKMAYMQALLVILFSYFGMKKYEKRIDYYKRKIIVHAAFLAFCIVLDAFVF
jgi:hypothetical protein